MDVSNAVATSHQNFSLSSHLSSNNLDYLEELYNQYLSDPEQLTAYWRSYFDALANNPAYNSLDADTKSSAQASGSKYDERERQVARLVIAYRSRGHLGTQLDPLGLMKPMNPPDLELAFHHLSTADLDTSFSTGGIAGHPRMKLGDLLTLLKATYTHTIGTEFMHIRQVEQRQWIYQRLESDAGKIQGTPESRLRILDRLTAAEGLERYLHTKYVGQKRFSLEGGDAFIALMDTLVLQASKDKVRDVVIGMAHRGRLNMLVNILGKAPRKLFDEFEGKFAHAHDDRAYSGDVKYHQGFSAQLATPHGPIHVALAFNPSHLEIVDPVVAGSVRARQERCGDEAKERVIPVLVHGDASLAGQGVVMELLQMSQLRGFGIGGTIHIVINNQIGFTTSHCEDARSTYYCTDVAKMIGAPVFHVNGDDPDAVAYVAQLAYEFRQTFKKDVFIDFVCYRRWGHNEADEPAMTQPLMYQAIRNQPTVREKYAQLLESEGVITSEQSGHMVSEYRNKLDAGQAVTKISERTVEEFAINWSKYLTGSLHSSVDTRVDMQRLEQLALTINTLPETLNVHPRVQKIYADRQLMAKGKAPLDWGFAENLAYATLLQEGFRLRITGQDVGRGTFSHRHAVLHDQHTDKTFLPLQQLVDRPANASIYDSLLSEEAVVAFEYGYSSTVPNTLCIWEAQFGDFANGAQVVFDQFIAAGEAKWGRISGLVLLLPHGYEGQGPEHSSARLERFLQLCALDNMQVCVPSTPAQYYHMIRRQLHSPARKPLVVMTPKSLLRHPLAISSMQDLADKSFQHILVDTHPQPDRVKRLILCTGKVYYDLVAQARAQSVLEIVLIRIEQLYPFPCEKLQSLFETYAHVSEIVWCQEEPENQGAWYQIRHHLQYCMRKGQHLSYAGRERASSPATGHHSDHQTQQQALIDHALLHPMQIQIPDCLHQKPMD